jgi:hypothetical protein
LKGAPLWTPFFLPVFVLFFNLHISVFFCL